MLHLKDKTKKKIAGLVDYKDLYIEKILESGDQLLSFLYPKKSKYYFDIEEECYINTKENEFIVKEKNVGSEYTTFKCVLNLEDLEGKPWERYESVEQPIDKALALALAGTGWIVGKCTLKKKRTVRATNCSSLEVIKNIRKTYRCDLVFNTLTRTIDVCEHLGEDKGTYFIDSLNLKELSIQGNSYDFFTRIIPIGKDNLRISSINYGKEYVENYQYSNKIKTIYWKDDRYTIVENLKEDAEAKLDEISKPYRSYSANILNLAKLNDKYKDILDYKLGDTITLISKDNKFRDKQRIVKIIEYPDEHEKDSVELANTTLSFEEMQTQFQEAADTVDNITTDNGTVDGSTINSIKTEQISDFETSVAKITDLTVVNAKIENLEAFNVSITGRLTAVEADIGALNANIGVIDKLTVTHTAQINNLIATKVDITDLNAVNASIQVLEAHASKIDTLLNGNLSSENIQAGGITGDCLNMNTIFVKDANIVSVNASKINAGEINTNKVKIKSDDGGIEIVGATQQFKDKNNKVRIQMGKDTQGNFNFIIRGEDGTTTLIDHTGVKEKAIADDLIKSNMIASDAVGEKQIDYNSFSKGFNKDTNTTTLKATKIRLDNQNQTLDIAFNQLKTQADGTKSLAESHSTTIGVIQGQISTAINNTQIVKDGQTILLKDDYNRTVATVDSMRSTIGSHTTEINQQTGQITGVTARVNTVERNLNGMSSKLNSVESTATTTKSKVSAIEQSLTNISARLINTESTLSTTKSDVTQIKLDLKGITQRVSSTEVKADSLLQSMNSGKVLYDDPTFLKGSNSINVYNNAGNGNVTVTRIAKVAGCPTNSTHCLEVKTLGVANPGHGGFYFGTITRANAIFITKIIAKIPTGKNIEFASNQYGSEGQKQEWLTPVEGTGKWETYICKVTCGSNGTFSSTNFFYLTGGEATTSKPLVWHVGYATVIDITDSSNLESRMSYAESKITSTSIIDTVSSQFYKKGEADSKYASQTQVSQLDTKITSKVETIENWQSSDTNRVINSKIYQSSNAYGFGYRDVMFERGKQYSFTVNGRVSQQALNDGKKLAVFIYNDDWTWSKILYIDSLENTNAYITFTAPDNGLHRIQSYLYPNGGSRAGEVTANWYKCVEGNRPSIAWSPAPEDINGRVDKQQSEIVQLSSQISTKVDVNGVISIIQQNSNAVNIAFNNINPNVQHTPGMFTIRNGKFEMFDNTNSKIMYVNETGLISSTKGYATYNPDQSGLHFLGNIIYHVPNKSDNYDNMYIESNKPIKFKTARSWDGIQGKDYQQIITSGVQLDGKAWDPSGIQGYILAADYELDTVVLYNQYKGLQMNIKARNAEFAQLTCSGAKNRIVDTKNYGTRRLNAVETCECYFEDRGRGKIKNGKCIIEIDPIFAETVNLNDYDVSISKYGKGDLWISERTKTYFVVECDNDIEFSYILYAKQLNYENHRLEIYKETKMSEVDKILIKNNLNLDMLKDKNEFWKIYEK